MQLRSLVRSARGLTASARRRGTGYFGNLLGGVSWPSAAYRFGWGPMAPPILQGVFAAAGEFAASKTDRAELERLRLIAPEATPIEVSDARPEEVEQLMNRAHAAGITGVAYSFGSFVRPPEGALAFGDLSKARKHRPDSVYFVAFRDADRREFNRSFGMSIMTEAMARESLRGLDGPVSETDRGQHPLDYRSGLTGERPAPDATARWDVFNRHVVAPLVAGKRVLDLGSNNAALPLTMLRYGAREVVAVEFMPAIAEPARPNARILSWRDVRPYDIHVVTGDMRLFVTEDLGSFDVVTAFCPLYYLPEQDLARIVQKAASMHAVLILQADDAIDSLPAKMLNLHRLMRDNGYPEVQVHTPGDQRRPLLVGFTHVSAAARGRDLASL
jgi:Methyltransferase domain